MAKKNSAAVKAKKSGKAKPKTKAKAPVKKSKPVVKAKAAKKPAKKNSVKKGNSRPAIKAAPVKAKISAKAPAKPKPVSKPTIISKNPGKNKSLRGNDLKKSAPVTKPITPAPPAVAPIKPPKAKTPKRPPAPVLPPIDTSKLPKLPKGIIVKRGKGKLAPGEKRLVKTDVITHHVIAEIELQDDKKNKPEPKGKFILEYIIRTPVSLLYDFLTTPNGLAEWFADGVDLKNDVYVFNWDGAIQYAKVISAKIDNHIRLRWLDKPEGYYFEFRLDVDELTNEVSLIVTDFGENDEEIKTLRHLWNTQVQRLIKALGTY